MLSVGAVPAHDVTNGPHLLFAEHSLVGKIWDVNNKKFIDKKILVGGLIISSFLQVLLMVSKKQIF